jgi:hypothetical protein
VNTNLEPHFIEVVQLIQQARSNAYKAVNVELVNLYWQVGEYISKRVATASWGDKTVDAGRLPAKALPRPEGV